MSREIKFRAWLNGRKMLVTNYDFVNGFATGIGWDVQEGEDEISWLTRDIEQFTGLRDKNGLTEIYEGDILSPEGEKVANIHEKKDRQGIDLVITGMGTRTWRDTEQEAIKRGCRYAQ
jgi:hypothetical protein